MFSRHRIVIDLFGVLLFSWLVVAQTAPTENKAQLFQAYFDALATEPHTPQRGNPHGAVFNHLIEVIPTMSTAELQQAISIIDASIDQARTSHDGIARAEAGMLLFYISGTKDGPSLMAHGVAHLSDLCRDPFTLTGSFTMFMLLQSQYPELSVSAMLQAIKAPDANSPAAKGPAASSMP